MKWQIAVNIIAVLGFVGGWGYHYVLVGLSAPMRVTELDRAGVINEEALKKAFPDLAVNTRVEVGRWIAEDERQAASDAILAGLCLSVVNLALSVALYRRRRAGVRTDAEAAAR